MTKTYNAYCTCGSLGYKFTTDKPPDLWNARKCTCSFCSKQKNHIYGSDPLGSVSYQINQATHLSRYQFSSKTADFITCSNCDSYLGAVMKSSKGAVTVTNIELVNIVLTPPTVEFFSFDGESLTDRLNRRLANWTPLVDSFVI